MKSSKALMALVAGFTVALAACGETDTIVGVQGVAADLSIVAADPTAGPVAETGASLVVGDSLALVATATNALGLAVGSVPVSWSTSNGAVATVSATGLVEAVATGEATITAAGADVEASLAVTVTEE